MFLSKRRCGLDQEVPHKLAAVRLEKQILWAFTLHIRKTGRNSDPTFASPLILNSAGAFVRRCWATGKLKSGKFFLFWLVLLSKWLLKTIDYSKRFSTTKEIKDLFYTLKFLQFMMVNNLVQQSFDENISNCDCNEENKSHAWSSKYNSPNQKTKG